jgi:hypothetical protein
MSDTVNTPPKPKLVTEAKIPGTSVPDVNQATGESERQKQWMSRVAVSTAIMAAIAAVSSSMGTGNLNQAMFDQIREADQWSFFQAKGIKEPIADADRQKLARYAEEKQAIRKDAEACRKSSDDHMRRYVQMSRAATATQIGIALAAVALLLRKNVFWALALLLGAVGAVFLTLGLLGA